MYSRKDTSPNYIEFSKNQTRIGRFAWSQKSYKGKIYFEPCFQLFKKNELGQLEKRQQVYLGEKEGEAISAIRNTVIHDAENLGLVPILELNSDKESTMDQELAKKFKPTSQSFWCTQHLHGINWSSGYEKYTELEKILKNLEATDTEFFAKGYEKCKILSEFLETKIINLDDYACPKVQFLIFKDKEYDWRCSNYPFRHAKTLHCAERKAFANGTWTRCFLTNCKLYYS